ncbi:MAG TPA: PorV/PorQ family protein [bacterium]|jgi:uncharacterized lipoprotein YbaY
MRTFLVVLLLMLAVSSSFAGTGLAFLEIPVGARESALGGSGVALITGPTSATYNPAVPAFTPRGIALMLTKHFADTRSEFIGFTVHRGRLALSPSYLGTRVSDIEFRDQPSVNPISTFDAVNSAVGAALAFKISDKYSVGVAGRYLYQKIQLEASRGYGLDAGALARDVVPGLTLGAAVQNMGEMSAFVVESPKLPTTVRGGAAYEHALPKIGSVMVTAEAQGIRDNKPLFKGGVEYRAPGYLALRAGYVQGLDAQNISFGLGFYISQFRLDYAFIPFKENLGEGHRFSFAFDI